MQGDDCLNDMYFIKRKILRWIYKHLLHKIPLDMDIVNYWHKDDAISAVITTNEEGATVMKMGEGDKREKYDFPGFPRGYLLFGNYKNRGHGALSVLKHEIKNQIFNYAWYALEEGKSKKEVIKHIKEVALPNIFAIAKDLEYEMLPPEKMFGGVKEIWRVMTLIEKRRPESKKTIENLKKTLTFIMSDDDAYRFRVGFIAEIFGWWSNPIKIFKIALQELEHAEVMQDMKGRIKLLRKVLMLLLEDKRIKELFLEFWKEVDWKKVRLSEADKYHFRAKYFKVDWNLFEY